MSLERIQQELRLNCLFGFLFVRSTTLKLWPLVYLIYEQAAKKPPVLFFLVLFSIVVFELKDLTRVLALGLLDRPLSVRWWLWLM